MKKTLLIILVIVLTASFSGCKKNQSEAEIVPTDIPVQTTAPEITEAPTEEAVATPESNTINTPQATKKPSSTLKPQATQKPATAKPATQEPTATQTPTATPTQKPTEAPKTLGNTLLSVFKSNASKSPQAIAEALMSSPAIKFAGGASPVEPGLLSGFGNTEIKGFKSGSMFAPMIGSIPFVGYVFELEDSKNVSSFISTLKSSADLRWNICVEAEEMVTGSSGNKVFFVMCPKSLDE